MKKAFTLIELLVVVLIIGILAAIALPQYQVAVEKSRAAEALVNLKYVQDAWTLYLLENGPHAWCPAKNIMELSGGEWDEDGYSYCTDKFMYQLEESTAYYVYRCSPDSDCFGCEDGTKEYQILVYLDLDDSCTAYTDLGYKVCKSLEGQGFTTVDER